MRWVRVEVDGKAQYGTLDGDNIALVDGMPWDNPKPTGAKTTLSAAKLLAPVVPPTFYAAGLNYVKHVIEQAEARGEEPKIPEAADIGYRAANAIIAHDEDVVVPADAPDKVQYEGELVVIVGKKAKNLTEETALSCVFGYTIGNDVSERTWQNGDRTMWRGKNTDTFKPMGPWIETDLKLDELETTVRVNGKETIRFPTNTMLFGVETYIARISKYITLYPGEVIWMGTEGKSPDLKDGDVVEIEINKIGLLRNRITRAK